jgi:hypothetical protein
MAESDGDTHLLPKLTCPKSLRGSMNAGVSPEGGGGMAGFYPPFSRRNMGQRSILRTFAGNAKAVRRISMRAFNESSECLSCRVRRLAVGSEIGTSYEKQEVRERVIGSVAASSL